MKLRFEVLREIGRGSLGIIYKAVDPNQQKNLALREIPRAACSANTWERLRKKAQAAIALDSPNIARTLEVAEAEDCFYVVTEYVEGATLRSLLEQKTSFSAGDLLDITRQVCTAIDHAHGRGLIHGNLHPGNCMQEWDGNIKLMDYDLALDVLEQTQTASVPEGLHYLSPEQAEGKPLDRRSNLFSWTAILYEMATGRRAFDGENAAAVLGKILGPDCFPVGLASPNLPGELLKKSLAKLPELRYQCGDDLVRDLEKWRKPNHGAVTVVAPAIQARGTPEAPNEVRTTTPPSAIAAPVPVVAPPPSVPIQPPAVRVPVPAPVSVVPVPPAKPQAPPPPIKPQAPPPIKPQAPPPIVPAVASTAEPAKKPAADFLFMPSRASSAPPPVPEAANNPLSKPVAVHPARSGARGVVRGVDRRFLLYGAGAAVLLLLGVLAGWGIRAQNRQTASREEAAPAAPAVQPVSQAADNTTTLPVASLDPADAALPAKKRKKAKPVAITAAPNVQTGELIIDSIPRGAQIELDGNTLGYLTPYTVAALPAGEHTITLTKAGYTVERRSFQLRASERSQLSIALVETGAILTVLSDPAGGAILLNGRDSGKLTPAAISVRAGSYKVSVAKSGYLAADKDMELASGQRYEFSARLTPMGNAEEIKATGKLKRLFGGSNAAGEMVQIRSKPRGAQISVNQRTLDKVTPAEFLFPNGFYDITLTLNGYKPVHKTVQVGGNGKVAVDVELQRAEP
jgi:serine/threonine protein kinase